MMHIVLGVLLAGASCFAIGVFLLKKLRLKFDGIELAALAFVVGAACFSQIVFLLCAIHLARMSVFVAIGAIAILAAILVRKGAATPARVLFRPRWRWFFGLLFIAFGVVYLVNAMAPEMSPDASAYHLPIIAAYLRAHGFVPITWNFYASLSEGIELVFLPAVAIGGHSAASMVHFLFLLDLPLLMICYGRRFGFPLPAAGAAFLVFASPVVGLDGTTAYIDVAVAAVLFALFYLLQVWDAERDSRLLIPIGILAGFSYAAKYTAAIAIPYALGFVAWKLWRAGKPVLRPALIVCALAAFFVLPWMIKDAVYVQNPVAPFANSLFPNPYVHVSFERQYREHLRHYLLNSWHQAPWELTVNGERLQGFFGPVFLLTPLALFALRHREGRQLLLAGVIFALPWFGNIGTRFLIPALPYFALALMLVLARPVALLAAVVLVHAFLSWYATPIRYFSQYAPRMGSFPIRAALRIEPEEMYLARNDPGYLVDRMIEKLVPPDEKVFSFAQIPEAWTTRRILVAYNSAENEVLADMLRTPIIPALQPTRVLEFRFSERQLHRIRAVEIASVSEFQVFDRNARAPSTGSWRMTAHPNPWDAQLAFDNNLATRWRSWQGVMPGMFVELGFGETRPVDEARVITAPDAPLGRVRLEGMDASGAWRVLVGRPSVSSLPVPDDLRESAAEAVVARGIRYLLVSTGSFEADDFRDHAVYWSAKLIGQSGTARLYQLGIAVEPEAPPPATRPIAVPPGTYDDADSRVIWRGLWSHDTQFPDAAQHTVTYSDVPGASVSLTFTGQEIVYVYTGARNRGIAEVRLDGSPRGRVDLYSADTQWQSRTSFAGLGPGNHTIEIRVTGEKAAAATGSFVDLDEFVVK